MRKTKKRYELLVYIFITFCCFAGLWLGLKLIGEDLPSGKALLVFILVGTTCGVGLPMLISWLKDRKRQPEMDERTVRMLKDYLLATTAGVWLLSGILLLVLFGMGYETIELGLIGIYGVGIVFLMTAGLFIVKRL
ncbi:hypothetical protein [Terribacillus saccharophilus]|uniref:hypothetical protein n=1 Tax=Terribacillus saccharophilus TaxID=361277 RepID=UPI003981F305